MIGGARQACVLFTLVNVRGPLISLASVDVTCAPSGDAIIYATRRLTHRCRSPLSMKFV